LKRLLPARPVVERFVVDFEAGMWAAIREVFPRKEIKGCSFHWTQAIWKHVQSIGLQAAYHQQGPVFRYIRKIMALPFLPHEHILASFAALRLQTRQPLLLALLRYVDETWMMTDTFPIKSWSVFFEPVRTNNDVEGWHRRLNHRADRRKLQIYMMVPVLYDEAELVDIQVQMVTQGVLTRYQRTSGLRVQVRLFDLWAQYLRDEISASQLVRKASFLNGPRPLTVDLGRVR
jgi:hypothetical protein